MAIFDPFTFLDSILSGEGMGPNSPQRDPFTKIRNNLLQPALTSHFEVEVGEPRDGAWSQFKSNNNLNYTSANGQEKLFLLCSETVLPGSSMATHQITGDYTGVTERHAYRRLFDDRIDLTFMVNANENAYLPIRFFEGWLKFIADEQDAEVRGGPGVLPGVGAFGLPQTGGTNNSVRNPNYSYRMKYPTQYQSQLKITKFERNGPQPNLVYTFLNAYPIAVTSMPVSYETSQLLKVTVSMTYVRYWIDGLIGQKSPGYTPSPQQQANQNAKNRPEGVVSGSGTKDDPWIRPAIETGRPSDVNINDTRPKFTEKSALNFLDKDNNINLNSQTMASSTYQRPDGTTVVNRTERGFETTIVTTPDGRTTTTTRSRNQNLTSPQVA